MGVRVRVHRTWRTRCVSRIPERAFIQEKFESGDKEKIEAAVQETLDWLDKNQLAEKDEFEAPRDAARSSRRPGRCGVFPPKNSANIVDLMRQPCLAGNVQKPGSCWTHMASICI